MERHTLEYCNNLFAWWIHFVLYKIHSIDSYFSMGLGTIVFKQTKVERSQLQVACFEMFETQFRIIFLKCQRCKQMSLHHVSITHNTQHIVQKDKRYMKKNKWARKCLTATFSRRVWHLFGELGIDSVKSFTNCTFPFMTQLKRLFLYFPISTASVWLTSTPTIPIDSIEFNLFFFFFATSPLGMFEKFIIMNHLLIV